MWKRFKALPRSLRVTAITCVSLTVGYVIWNGVLIIVVFGAMANAHRDISKVTVNELAKETGLVFPPEAKITRFVETPPIDPVWVARISMPLSAEQELLAVVAGKPSVDAAVSGAKSESTSWWRPTHIVFKKLYHHRESGALVNVVVSEEPGELVAYIEHAVF